MTIYVVQKYDSGYWENVRAFNNYEKAFNLSKQMIVEYCKHDEYAEVEECLEALEDDGYVEEVVGIDELEVE